MVEVIDLPHFSIFLHGSKGPLVRIGAELLFRNNIYDVKLDQKRSEVTVFSPKSGFSRSLAIRFSYSLNEVKQV